ncbi:hypothetical protein ACIRBX_22285 [Kitasatospora sp. NPDC096147]|uniref:hypothetical protein n=1 Tax=Kitasatospora sp. NPDC096147 TaxID=3364093 RepID=UPI003804CECF
MSDLARDAWGGGITVPSAPNPPIHFTPPSPIPELRDANAVMEELFHGLVGERTLNGELTGLVLYAVRWLVTEPGYTEALTAFTRDRERELRRLYAYFGPGSAHDTGPHGPAGPRYVLIRQSESLILAHLLTYKRVTLAGACEGLRPGALLGDMVRASPHGN